MALLLAHDPLSPNASTVCYVHVLNSWAWSHEDVAHVPFVTRAFSRVHWTKKWFFFTLIQSVFIDFRSRCFVTSGDVITPPSHARDLGTLWGVAASVRGSIQHNVFSDIWPPMRGDWGAVWGSRTHKLTLSPRLRRVWGPHKKLVGCFLIGRNGSREHKWWRSNANETRDPLKQYPYCVSRALIGYRPG